MSWKMNVYLNKKNHVIGKLSPSNDYLHQKTNHIFLTPSESIFKRKTSIWKKALEASTVADNRAQHLQTGKVRAAWARALGWPKGLDLQLPDPP